MEACREDWEHDSSVNLTPDKAAAIVAAEMRSKAPAAAAGARDGTVRVLLLSALYIHAGD